MLNIMRKNAQGWIIKTILFIIVLVFMFWGVGSFKSNMVYKVATVNNEDISFEEYSRLYQNLMNEYNHDTTHSELFNEDINNTFKSFALKQIIDRRLILQQAIKTGLKVTDKELLKYIQKNPLFLKDGIFNASYYEALLAKINYTPYQFEKYNRETILVKKFINLINGMISVSQSEIKDWYDWYYSPISLTYILFNPDDYEINNFNEEQLYEYFREHQEYYRTKSKTKIHYTLFTPKNYLNSIRIDDSEILEYYNLHQNEFFDDKRIDVSHILIKIDPNDELEECKNKEKHINNILKMVNEGTDFSELAKLYSECSTRKQGGMLGSVTYNSLISPLAEKAFSMNVGEISSPIKTRFGWHVIKINGITEARELSFNESKKQIKDTLIDLKADNTAYEEALNLLETCLGEHNLFDNAALCKTTSLHEIDLFDDENKKLLEFSKNDSSIVRSVVSSMEIGEISDIYKLSNSYLVVQVKDRIDSKIPSFNDVKEEVTKKFVIYKQKIEASSNAESFLATVKNGMPFEEAANTYTLVPINTNFFTRNKITSTINLENTIFNQSFSLVQSGDLVDKPIETEQGFCVVMMAKKKDPEPIDDPSIKLEKNVFIIDNIVKNKQSKLISEIITNLRQTSKIKINDNLTFN